MANEQNLKPFSKENLEETVKNARKGGIASGKAKAEKRLLKNIAQAILNSPIEDENYIEQALRLYPELDREQITHGFVMLANFGEMIKRRKIVKVEDKNGEEIKISVPYYKPLELEKISEFIRDTSGQKPIEKQEVKNINSDGYMQVLINGEDEFNEDLEENNNEE